MNLSLKHCKIFVKKNSETIKEIKTIYFFNFEKMKYFQKLHNISKLTQNRDFKIDQSQPRFLDIKK